MDFCERTAGIWKTSARTYDTMQYLRDRYGQETVSSCVCGTDAFRAFNLV